MKMSLRWFGPKEDTVPLSYIAQIPGVKGVVTTLLDKMPGEIWNEDEIAERIGLVRKAGLSVLGIESVNISDDIKTGTAKRDEHISNYIKTLDNLGKAGIDLICYNFMPVFDWTRTDLFRERSDGSKVFAYDQSIIDKIDPEDFRGSFEKMLGGYVMPGWEPERMDHVLELFELYKDIDESRLFNNLVYFLEAIGPVCEKYGIKMAIHPDDPAWPIFGLPRIMTGPAAARKLLDAVDKPYNCITLCTGSMGSDPDNDILSLIHSSCKRIPFAHIRNIRYNSPTDFEECAHLSDDGSMDMYEIVKALFEEGFDGVIRPDHGRMIWGEEAMPGYGLYDRALGAMYITGLWEAISKQYK